MLIIEGVQRRMNGCVEGFQNREEWGWPGTHWGSCSRSLYSKKNTRTVEVVKLHAGRIDVLRWSRTRLAAPISFTSSRRISILLTTVGSLSSPLCFFFILFWCLGFAAFVFVLFELRMVLGIFSFVDEVFFGATETTAISASSAEVGSSLRKRDNTHASSFRFIGVLTDFATLLTKRVHIYSGWSCSRPSLQLRSTCCLRDS